MAEGESRALQMIPSTALRAVTQPPEEIMKSYSYDTNAESQSWTRLTKPSDIMKKCFTRSLLFLGLRWP